MRGVRVPRRARSDDGCGKDGLPGVRADGIGEQHAGHAPMVSTQLPRDRTAYQGIRPTVRVDIQVCSPWGCYQRRRTTRRLTVSESIALNVTIDQKLDGGVISRGIRVCHLEAAPRELREPSHRLPTRCYCKHLALAGNDGIGYETNCYTKLYSS